MTCLVGRHIATAVRRHKRGTVARVSWEIVEPVGSVRAVSFAHARSKAAKAYPAVEQESMRVTLI
jgi:hypothetical protein